MLNNNQMNAINKTVIANIIEATSVLLSEIGGTEIAPPDINQIKQDVTLALNNKVKYISLDLRGGK